jgi:tetratricopeptide (TPR) repeat protein
MPSRGLRPAYLIALAAIVHCGAQDLREGEIRLQGKLIAVDVGQGQITLRAERFAVPPNREGTIEPAKNKRVAVTPQTVVSLGGKPEERLSFKDLKAGMEVAVTGTDLGEGKLLPARLVVVLTGGTAEEKPAPAAETRPGEPPAAQPAAPESGLDTVATAMEEGRWNEALTALAPLLTTNWRDETKWRLAAKLLAQAKLGGEADLAARFKAALLPAAGDNAERRNRVLAVLVTAGFPELALSEYAATLQEDRMNAAAYAGQAAAYLALFDLAKAEGSADLAIKVNGNYIPAYLMKAKVHLERRSSEIAVEVLRLALKKEPKSTDAHGLMAQALLLTAEGTPQQTAAEAEIRRALEVDPENAEALFAQGILQEQRGEVKEAQQAWDRYLEVDPVSRRARAVLNGLVIVRETRLSKENGQVYGWTRDGLCVLFVPDADAGTVHLVAADGSGQEKVMRVIEKDVLGGADLSPDGRFLACVTVKWGPQVRKLYVQPADNAAAAVLLTESVTVQVGSKEGGGG